MAEDLSEVREMSKQLGPKKVRTPQVESEQFDPITVIKARNLLAAQNFQVSLSNMNVDVAVPKDRRCSGCNE